MFCICLVFFWLVGCAAVGVSYVLYNVCSLLLFDEATVSCVKRGAGRARL